MARELWQRVALHLAPPVLKDFAVASPALWRWLRHADALVERPFLADYLPLQTRTGAGSRLSDWWELCGLAQVHRSLSVPASALDAVRAIAPAHVHASRQRILHVWLGHHGRTLATADASGAATLWQLGDRPRQVAHRQVSELGLGHIACDLSTSLALVCDGSGAVFFLHGRTRWRSLTQLADPRPATQGPHALPSLHATEATFSLAGHALVWDEHGTFDVWSLSAKPRRLARLAWGTALATSVASPFSRITGRFCPETNEVLMLQTTGRPEGDAAAIWKWDSPDRQLQAQHPQEILAEDLHSGGELRLLPYYHLRYGTRLEISAARPGAIEVRLGEDTWREDFRASAVLSGTAENSAAWFGADGGWVAATGGPSDSDVLLYRLGR